MKYGARGRKERNQDDLSWPKWPALPRFAALLKKEGGDSRERYFRYVRAQQQYPVVKNGPVAISDSKLLCD